MKRRKVLVATVLVAALPLHAGATLVDVPDSVLEQLCANPSPKTQKWCKKNAHAYANAKGVAPPLAPISGEAPRNLSPPSVELATTPVLPTLSTLVSNSIGNCTPAGQALFVRADSLDNFNYLTAIKSSADPSDSGLSPNGSAKGLSVSYTDNINANTQTVTINGRISYLLIGEQQCWPTPFVPITDAETGKTTLGPGNPLNPFIIYYGFRVCSLHFEQWDLERAFDGADYRHDKCGQENYNYDQEDE